MTAGLPVAALVLGLAAFFGYGLSSIDDAGGYAGLSPRFLPTLVTVGLTVAGLAIAVQSLRGRFSAATDDGEPSPSARRDLAWLAGGLLAHMALIGVVGFVLAGALLLAMVAHGYGSRRPGRDLLVGLAVTVPLWLLFARLLGVSLPLAPVLGL